MMTISKHLFIVDFAGDLPYFGHDNVEQNILCSFEFIILGTNFFSTAAGIIS